MRKSAPKGPRGWPNSSTTTRPPGRTTRAISRRQRTGSSTLRMPKPMDATSNDASVYGSASASATSNRTRRPARRAFAGAEASISAQKSVPTTSPEGPTALLNASARSPVPVAQSRTRSPGSTPESRTAARRHPRWTPSESTSFAVSYRRAIEANISRTCSLTAGPPGGRLRAATERVPRRGAPARGGPSARAARAAAAPARVAERLLGPGVHLHQEPVGAGRRRGQRKRQHEIGPAGRVRGIHHHGQVRTLLRQRDGGDVEGVARRRLESADAPFAEDHLVVAARQQILGREEPFLDGRGGAALEQHRPAQARQRLEQGEVLHVAGANLEERGALERGKLGGLHHLGDGGEPVPLGGLEQQPRSLRAEPLECVWTGTGLESASPQDRATRLRDRSRRLLHLPGALHRARAGHDDEGAAAQLDGPPRSGQPHHRPRRAGTALDQAGLFANPLHQSLQNVLKQVVCSEARRGGQEEGAGRRWRRTPPRSPGLRAFAPRSPRARGTPPWGRSASSGRTPSRGCGCAPTGRRCAARRAREGWAPCSPRCPAPTD